MNCALGNCTANCTGLGSVLYKNLGMPISKQLSKITNSDFNSINYSTFSTGVEGMAPRVEEVIT